MKESKDRVSRTDLRPLKQSIHDLADTVDMLVDELDEQTPGNGPPKHAQNAKNAAQNIRENAPNPVEEAEGIKPPWEREGYDSKQAWLDNK